MYLLSKPDDCSLSNCRHGDLSKSSNQIITSQNTKTLGNAPWIPFKEVRLLLKLDHYRASITGNNGDLSKSPENVVMAAPTVGRRPPAVQIWWLRPVHNWGYRDFSELNKHVLMLPVSEE